MSGRILFLVPMVYAPVGGTKVCFQFIELLRAAGFAAAPVYNNARYRYIYSDYADESYYLPDLSFWPRHGLKSDLKYRYRWRLRAPFIADTPHPKLDLQPEDVIVHPEFVYDLTTVQFPANRNVLMAQDVYGLLRAKTRHAALHTIALDGAFATSEASAATARYLGHTDIGIVPLTVEAQPVAWLEAPKKKQIAFMRRKRPDDIDLMQSLLLTDPALQEYTLVPIDGVSNEELHLILRDSLFFLSFSKQEGFGLPPAEAMAAGCITIGYTGVGGEEYFTPENGFPIKDGDMVAFAETLSNLAREYAETPDRLDAFRRAAAMAIRDRYSEDRTRAALLRFWDGFEKT